MLSLVFWRFFSCVCVCVIFLSGAVPTPRYFHSCAVHNGSMYVFGGYNGSDRLCDFFEHNFDTGTWTELVSVGLVVSGDWYDVIVVQRWCFVCSCLTFGSALP